MKLDDIIMENGNVNEAQLFDVRFKIFIFLKLKPIFIADLESAALN